MGNLSNPPTKQISPPAPPIHLKPARGDGIITPQQRRLLMTVRQALIMMLGALEEYLGLERSITPKSDRC